MRLREETDDVVLSKVVDEIEAEHTVEPAAQLGRGRVAIPMQDPIRHPRLGDDLPADRRAARQVKYGRGEPRVAPAQLGRVPAVTTADVQERAQVAGQSQLPGDLGRTEPGEVGLAADIPR